MWKHELLVDIVRTALLLLLTFRAFLHGVGDPGLVELVSFVFTLWSPTPCKQGLSPAVVFFLSLKLLFL